MYQVSEMPECHDMNQEQSSTRKNHRCHEREANEKIKAIRVIVAISEIPHITNLITSDNKSR